MSEDADEEEKQNRIRDGRNLWQSTSKYKARDRIQFGLESAYLIGVIVIACFYKWRIMSCLAMFEQEPGELTYPICSAPALGDVSASMVIIAALGLSGVIGGAAFALKWLYHGVAKGIWHQDRLVWRISVPLMGGVLGVFVSFIFSGTFGASFANDGYKLTSLLPACGFSFIVGIFADGVLASLERIARRIFGTLEDFGQ